MQNSVDILIHDGCLWFCKTPYKQWKSFEIIMIKELGIVVLQGNLRPFVEALSLARV